MSILITICARGGSKGIPGKNIKLLNGKSLINYTIDCANQFKEAFPQVDVALSTDSEEIIRVAAQYGLVSEYRRPEEFASDGAGKIAAIQDVLAFYEKRYLTRYDFVLDLDVTSPLRNLDDLKAAFKILLDNPEAVNLFSVSMANRNPYFNMVEQNANGFYSQVKQLDSNVFTRQSAPKVYDLNASFYFYRRSFFDVGYKGTITDKSLIYLVPHMCFDLDHQVDFEFLTYLLRYNKLDFSL